MKPSTRARRRILNVVRRRAEVDSDIRLLVRTKMRCDAEAVDKDLCASRESSVELTRGLRRGAYEAREAANTAGRKIAALARVRGDLLAGELRFKKDLQAALKQESATRRRPG